MNPAEITILTIKLAGRFKAVVGDHVEYGDYATLAARRAAALHFDVPEEQIEIEPIDARLTARVRRA